VYPSNGSRNSKKPIVRKIALAIKQLIAKNKEHGHFEKAHAHFPNWGGGFAYQPID